MSPIKEMRSGHQRKKHVGRALRRLCTLGALATIMAVSLPANANSYPNIFVHKVGVRGPNFSTSLQPKVVMRARCDVRTGQFDFVAKNVSAIGSDGITAFPSFGGVMYVGVNVISEGGGGPGEGTAFPLVQNPLTGLFDTTGQFFMVNKSYCATGSLIQMIASIPADSDPSLWINGLLA